MLCVYVVERAIGPFRAGSIVSWDMTNRLAPLAEWVDGEVVAWHGPEAVADLCAGWQSGATPLCYLSPAARSASQREIARSLEHGAGGDFSLRLEA